MEEWRNVIISKKTLWILFHNANQVSQCGLHNGGIPIAIAIQIQIQVRQACFGEI
jgi:hypothetical protein